MSVHALDRWGNTLCGESADATRVASACRYDAVTCSRCQSTNTFGAVRLLTLLAKRVP